MANPTRKDTVKRSKVVRLRQKNPCYSLQDIGNVAGLSRERVRQILSQEGVETKLILPKNLICPQCLIHFHTSDSEIKNGKVFCSTKCIHDFAWGTFSCDECGKLFERKKVEVVNNHKNYETNNHHIFCSRRCQGIWLGKHHGFQKNDPRTTKPELNNIVEVECGNCHIIYQITQRQKNEHDRYNGKPKKYCYYCAY